MFDSGICPKQVSSDEPGYGFLHPERKRIFKWADWETAVAGAFALGINYIHLTWVCVVFPSPTGPLGEPGKSNEGTKGSTNG